MKPSSFHGLENAWQKDCQFVAGVYLEALADIPELTLPHIPDWASPTWHIFAIRHPKRDDLRRHLQNKGVDTLIHYPVPPPLSSAYSEMRLVKGASRFQKKLPIQN